MWEFCLFGFFLFLKLSDSPVKYIVKLFCLFMIMGAKGFSYIMFTSHSHAVRGSVVVSPFCKCRTLRLREVKSFAQGHENANWRSQK